MNTYKIATQNKISQKGLGLLSGKYELTDDKNEADAIIVRSADMHDMELPENLLAIARAGAGVNNIPIDRCAERGVVVFNTPGANANAVKELVIASIIMASRNIPPALEWAKTLGKNTASAVEKGKAQFAGEEIKGKTLGVVGLGYVGVLVANIAEALGMKAVGYDPYISLKAADGLSPSVRLYDKLPAMLPLCDFVTVHVPANSETSGMFDHTMLDAMKKKCVLLNFSRDDVVVGADIVYALAEKKLRCYVTDFPTDEMYGVEGAVLIPHLGASTKESEENCALMAVEQVMDYLENGNITNSVNFPSVHAGEMASGPRIIALHKNIPSMLGKQTGILADMGVNIANLVNKSKGDYACTIVDCDEEIDARGVQSAFAENGVISVRILHNI